MDWVRTAYQGSWRLFRDRPDIVTKGYYYFVDEDTPVYEGENFFGSADWVHNADEPYTPPALGEDESLGRVYRKGDLAIPLPGGTVPVDRVCVANGEGAYPAPLGRTFPMGVDSRCYAPASAPLAPMGGMLFWHRPEGLPLVADGDPVSLWRNEGFSKGDLAELAPSPTPTLLEDGPGGLPACIFATAAGLRHGLAWGVDGDGIPHPFLLGTAYSVYLVCTRQGALFTQMGGSVDGAGLPSQPVLTASTGTLAGFVSAASASAAVAFPQLEPHIFHVQRSGPALVVGMDGVDLAAGTVSATTLQTATALACSALGGSANRITVVSEVLGYDWSVDLFNHRMIVAYLASRYGIALP